MDHFATPVDSEEAATSAILTVTPDCQIVTPISGTVAPLDSVPDPRLAAGAFGAGLAVIPDFENEQVTVVAPVSGILRRFMPHFFLIVTDEGSAVYTQLGIDTDMLDGTGFSPHVREGDRVVAGQRVTTYAPRQLGRLGFDPVVPVVAVQYESVTAALLPGEPCEQGDVLFTVAD
ncbi:PTS glucose transporter subunit IIA [Corynebacterium terpenotabidum]|uniref:PTS system N-acetylglucosamine-specific component II n=1 Tax=Corynebacterium terpenotabidum Y-11 TaxID=1200352 RepID=S4XBY1_9CORY|nr:PTS glucose transporter subunit IIA [Corynebacterium terpenotabidum]AGP29949.1 PTS system N-acetylglucosamine-specific component II [Corynebacterium terpenotabidum Y-11]